MCGALVVLSDEAFTIEEKQRFLDEVPENTWVRKQYSGIFRKLRKAVGEDDVSESESES